MIQTFYKIIDNAYTLNKLSQVYLLEGQNSINFEPYILYFCNKLNNDNIVKYEELSNKSYVYKNTNKQGNISKEEINALIQRVYESTFNVKRKKILIIENVENGNISTLNSLLKFLENPPLNTYILLTTNNIDFVLKTIKSRANIITINKNISNHSNIQFASFYSLLTENEEQLNLIKQDLSIELLEQTYSLLCNAPVKPLTLLSFLDMSIKDNNFKAMILFIKQFLLETVKTKTIAFSNNFIVLKTINCIKKWHNFDKENELIELCNQTLEIFNINVNMNLQIKNFISKLGAIYGI
ncbi:DNA polymerase III subunit delta [Metamycoplasma cloacale]|uniref:hypothetical protein n=1 Tax=Metamycoplasma cloacale TaxID=92401 RepID=UPI00068E5E17|nr:hypothetical protein [Metamycoplasma cloacale]VEU79263.1 DNA polymerase III subunit delta [Metamycoplasma cloacale]